MEFAYLHQKPGAEKGQVELKMLGAEELDKLLKENVEAKDDE